MELNIYYKGKQMGTVRGDTITFDALNAELNAHLDALFQVRQEEDEDGNVELIREPPSMPTKLAGLHALGYELREAHDETDTAPADSRGAGA